MRSPLGRGLLAGLLCTVLAAAPAAADQPDCRALGVREQAQQTVMAGFAGTEPTTASRGLVTHDVGGVILMGHNVADARQVQALTADLRARAPHGLLVAVDEEGGRVARLGDKGAAPVLPSPRSLQESNSAAEVRALAADLGRHLRELGVDWNLAPVLDVTDAPPGTVIGDRAWAGDPELVAEYGAAFARGMTDAGILTAGKHFPGHGPTDVDSHAALPIVGGAAEELRARDLVPFLRAGSELDAVMTAHVVVPALDPDLPASLSAATTSLLRDELGYDGLLVTDALEMGAIAERWDVPAAAELAIAAGADVVLVVRPGTEAAQAADRIAEAVDSGRIAPQRLQEAASRVLLAKGYTASRIDCLLGVAPSSALRLRAELEGAERALVSLVLSRVRYGDGEAGRVLLASDATGPTARWGAGRADGPTLHVPDGASPARQAAIAAEVRRVLAADGTIQVLDGVPPADLGALNADPRIRRVPGR